MNSDMNVQQIVELVGGADNIKTVTHCATRLRFVCKKDEVVDVKGLEGTKGVIKVILAGGQVQVVIGPQVEFVYKDVIDLIGESFASAGMEDADTSKPLGKRIVDAVFDLLSGSFTPLLPAMAGVGMVRALMVLLTSFGIVAEDSTTYSILLGIYDGFFYFLPIILSVSMANKLGSNMFIAATIAAAVLDPNIAGLVDQKDVTFFGLPLITMSYASTVLPVLITIPCYSAVYNWLKAHVSRNYQNLVVPFVCIILFVPFILFIFGPFGKYVGDLLIAGISAIMNVAPWLAGAFLGGFWSMLVLFGLHWPFVALGITNIAATGSDVIIACAGMGATFASIGICLGLILKAKDLELRELMVTAIVPALFVGITEPILYCAVLRYKRLLAYSIIAGAVSGAICAVMGVKATAAFFSILALNIYLNWQIGLVAGIVAMAICIGLIAVFGYGDADASKTDDRKFELEV